MKPSELRAAVAKAYHFLRTDAPKIVGIEAKKHFQDSFQRNKQGFTDTKLVKWKDIKESTKKRKRRKYGSLTPILTGEGHLRDSIEWEADYNKVEISSDKVYAQIHNEGGQAGRNGSATIPKRQFMGPSKALDDKISNMLDQQLDRIFK